MSEKKERSVWSVFFITYKEFVLKKPKQFLIMTLLSLLPALVSPVKVYLERVIFECANQIILVTVIDEKIYRVFFLVILVQLLYMGVYPLFRAHVNYFGSEFETVLQNAINRKTENISLESYERRDFYKDVELASSASRELRFMTMMFSSEILLYLFQFIAVSWILFAFNPLLVLLSFLALVPDIFSRFLKAKWQYMDADITQPILQRKKYFEGVLTAPQNIKEVRVYQNRDFFHKLWNQEREILNQKCWKLQKRNTFLDLLVQLVNLITVAITYSVTIWLTLRGNISIGAFGASIGAVNTLKSNFGRICNLAMFSFQCGLKGKYYYKILDYEERKGIEKNVSAKKGICIENVCFSYVSQRRALNKISFQISPGERVAVVGENGSGKSTMVKVLLGLFTPESGAVYYGNEKINTVCEKCIYQEGSAVFQDFCRYALTLEENVSISDTARPVDRDRIQWLLDSVSFNFGDQTFSSDLGREFGGIELSGGNWQKVAIARGLYKPHHLIVFDEPTAALDPLVEEKIIRCMLELDQDSIKVFVTHRLNSTKFADKIVVLENGNIVGYGTHNELFGKNPIYTKLWKAQAKWYLDE